MNDPSPPAFDCRQCGERLLLIRSAYGPIGYYRCFRCDRQFASHDADALARPHADGGEGDAAARLQLDVLRGRLDRFLARAEGEDPLAILGLRPGDGLALARERFHALALTFHPDCGGDADAMRRLIEAYDLVRDRLARAGREAPSVPTAPARPSSLVRREPASWARARAAQAHAPEDPTR